MNAQPESQFGTELLDSLRNQIHLDPQEVSDCAYAVWESSGKPDGEDRAHWFQAEAQLLFDAAQDRGLLGTRVAGKKQAKPRGKKQTSRRPSEKTPRKTKT